MFLSFLLLWSAARAQDCALDQDGKIVDKRVCVVNGKEFDCGVGWLTYNFYASTSTCEPEKVTRTNCVPLVRILDCEKARQVIGAGWEKNTGLTLEYGKCLPQYKDSADYVITTCQVPGGEAADCESDSAQNCLKCQEVSEQCKDCEGKMDSDECVVCKICETCKPFAECEKKEKTDCKDMDLGEGCEVPDWDIGRVCKECLGEDDCDTREPCKACMPYVRQCLQGDFCEENKGHECMDKCKDCVSCFSEETKSSDKCATCNDCQRCSSFGVCMTGGLGNCKAEKIGPVMMQHLDKADVKKCLDLMAQPIDGKLTQEECDCLTSIPQDVMEENDCFFQTESLGSMRTTCDKAEAPDCGIIDDKKDCNKLKPACKWKKRKCNKVVVKCKKIKNKDACDANDACKSDSKKGKLKCKNKKN